MPVFCEAGIGNEVRNGLKSVECFAAGLYYLRPYPLFPVFVLLHVGGGDGVKEALGEGVGVAGGEAGGGDGVADDDGDGAGMEMVGVDWEELVGSNQGDGDERDLGLNGHIGATGEEWVGASVGGAAAFGEDDEGQAVFEGRDTTVEAGYGVACAGLIDRDLAGTVEIPADEGSLPEGLFGEDTELEGEFGEEDGGVVVAEVVGGVDGDLVLVELLFIDEPDGGEANEEEASGPDVGDEVLLAAGFVPKTADEGDAAEENGGDNYEGEKEEVGEPAEEG
jgi:hypothetical protein